MNLDDIDRIITTALTEDIGTGDITSDLLIPQQAVAELAFVAREPLVVCGLVMVQKVYARLDSSIRIQPHVEDGEHVAGNTPLITAGGSARALLAGERVALNLIQRMCGVATLTRRYVEAVRGSRAVILDTRKTMPGLRVLDKYAVRTGGGQNHRMRLDDMVLIKDNHIAVCGSIRQAIEKIKLDSRLREKDGIPIVIECDTLEQVKEALAAKPDRILLDNMTLGQLREAVTLAAGKVPLEASGGVSLETIRAIANMGVDYISIGAITHSVPAVDIGADIRITEV